VSLSCLRGTSEYLVFSAPHTKLCTGICIYICYNLIPLSLFRTTSIPINRIDCPLETHKIQMYSTAHTCFDYQYIVHSRLNKQIPLGSSHFLPIKQPVPQPTRFFSCYSFILFSSNILYSILQIQCIILSSLPSLFLHYFSSNLLSPSFSLFFNLTIVPITHKL